MTLTREQIEAVALIEIKRRHPQEKDPWLDPAVITEVAAILNAYHTVRALPLPEGEVKELATAAKEWTALWAHELGGMEEADGAGGDKLLAKLIGTIERQAASLATVERERDAYKAENVEVRQTWLRERAELAKAADTAEASLASARRALAQLVAAVDAPVASFRAKDITNEIAAAREVLASPRQEDTQR